MKGSELADLNCMLAIVRRPLDAEPIKEEVCMTGPGLTLIMTWGWSGGTVSTKSEKGSLDSPSVRFIV